MKKALIAVAALAALSSSAFAATPTGNPGTINFIGEIVAGACGISADTLDQTVSLGQVPAGEFAKAGDRSQTPAPFNIVLTDCNIATAKNAFFTFTGTSDVDVPGLFAVTGGAGNVGIRLQTASGEYLDNGAEQKSTVVLSNGNNTVRFAAMYEATQATVTPGVADSVANFTVRYQ
ncbi:fimbrial protein [Paraburkholderia sp. HD33-4]|uniref:fimbrial protein n=1 Tax=Paraburkholderia sp. HD33-4 TaxID=2883242 RepID=UPI001F46C362|nr:fimbrial protein [Paraburkholderia sp. HD33-4]